MEEKELKNIIPIEIEEEMRRSYRLCYECHCIKSTTRCKGWFKACS